MSDFEVFHDSYKLPRDTGCLSPDTGFRGVASYFIRHRASGIRHLLASNNGIIVQVLVGLLPPKAGYGLGRQSFASQMGAMNSEPPSGARVLAP